MTEVRLHEIKGNPPCFHLTGGDDILTGAANRFLTTLKTRGHSWRTIRAYGFDLVTFFRWIKATETNFADLTQTSLLEFMAFQQSVDAGPSSINRRLNTVEQYYRFVHDRHLPRGNGVTCAKPNFHGQGYDRNLGLFWQRRSGDLRLRVKMPVKLVEPLTPEEVKAFLQSLRCYRDLAMTLAMGLCGLRSCEVLSLRIDNVDLARGRMRFRGKGNRERLVPMAPQLVDAVRKYLVYERPELTSAPELFVSLQGHHLGLGMSSAGLISLFQRKRRKTSLAKANPHRFRHTFGADMARAGMQLPTLQKLMGHASYETTLRYIFLNIEDVTEEFHRTMERLAKRHEQHPVQTT